MCLSTVFQCQPESDETVEVCSSISSFHVSGDTITFIDLLGEQYELKGSITEVDFVKSRIYVSA